MSWYKRAQLSRRIVVIALLVIGLGSLGNSLSIYAKASLAQYLIASAWGQALQDNEHHKPWPWADTWPVGRLQATQPSVDLYTLQGLGGNALAFGPGQIQMTQEGFAPTIVIAGHRDTHFDFMRELAIGDELQLTQLSGFPVVYQVVDLAVVDSRHRAIEPSPTEPTLMLVTCYPFDAVNANGPMRYVATATVQTQSLHL